MKLFGEFCSMITTNIPNINVDIISRMNYFVLMFIRKFFHRIALNCVRVKLIRFVVGQKIIQQNLYVQIIMSQKKYSDTSDKFLCDILSKKCNDFLQTYSTAYHNASSQQFLEISESVKFTSSQIKTKKTIIRKNKIIYSNIVTHPAIQRVAQEQSQELRKKQEQLLAQLMKRIIQNIKANLQQVLNHIQQFTNKDIFRSVLFTLEDQFELVNLQLDRVCKYTKKKQIRDVFSFEISSICPGDFLELIFQSLPTLKEFFVKFQLETLTNQQIQQLKQSSSLIHELVDLDALAEKRTKEKKLRKRQNKKKNKMMKCESQSTNNQQPPKAEALSEPVQNKIAQFLNSLVINQGRATCNASDDWIKQLKIRYVF